jgi:hypothetical protein
MTSCPSLSSLHSSSFFLLWVSQSSTFTILARNLFSSLSCVDLH